MTGGVSGEREEEEDGEDGARSDCSLTSGHQGGVDQPRGDDHWMDVHCLPNSPLIIE